jgi:AbrB family looped-hinge helix DNA binding protein
LSEETTIGKRGTIVIPKEIRDKQELEEGQRVLIRIEGRKIIIHPLPKDPLKVLEDVIGEPYNEEEDEERAERWLKKHASG